MGDPAGVRTLVIIPAYNEEASIARVVAEVRDAGYPCLVIDDASDDRTVAVVGSLPADLLCLPVNLGVGGALKAGFQFAVRHGYTRIVQVDGDGQHPADQIDRLIATADGDANVDMVVGSRFAGRSDAYPMSRVRRMCIDVLARRVRRAGLRITDPTSGFRVIQEPLLSQFASDFPAHYLGDTFEAYLVAGRRGYRVVEAGVVMRERQGGRPSADLYALVRAMVRSLAVALTGPSFDVAPR